MSILLKRRAMIGALLLVLALGGAACSTLRLAYSNAPTLAWWWLDGYADFPREQAPAARAALDRWFDWHRGTQLADYAGLLAAAQREIGQDATPAQMCRWWGELRQRYDSAVDAALPAAADLAPALTVAQLQHIEQRFAKGNAALRDEQLQPDPATRRREAVKRAVERAERLYGRLSDGQRALVESQVAASPFDPEAWMAERERRQRDLLQTLRRLQTDPALRADRAARLAALRALALRQLRSSDPGYAAHQQRLADYNCAYAARVHNATTPAQRQRARELLKGWEDDLRAILAVPQAPRDMSRDG